MAELQEWNVTETWLDLHCALGEGPFYDKASGIVRFVDIKQKRVHLVSLAEGPPSLRTIQLDVPVGVTCNIAGVDPRQRILIGVKTGIAILDLETESYEMISSFSEPPNDRLRGNDGGADPHGRFWFGNMTDFPSGDCQPEGSLYRFDEKKSPEVFLTGLTIPNGVGWSPDKKTMYFTHSSEGKVYAFDYDLETGDVSNKRILYDHLGSADPDGFRVDAQGNIWHAVYGEGRVLKISPQGKLVGQVILPTRNITCVQFAGTELVITTASDDSGDDQKSKTYGGAVFKVDVNVEGLDLFDFKL
ncbi:putative sugar lactone lactonase-like protein [Emericellopsis cladophorae]|uniref:Sugar lactone lactonase-like protein n=1 Tax=Emericellopsis cladophorae TaxID=2686198 RepID=A0A9P9XYE2_9HYPO|nr:putative sugar lactone lactonase-like protein [Emericellopsis cladophorae]KAI6780132.1 putative sugar lactone lactonase-like protein [Emericellopsis cladophorae]